MKKKSYRELSMVLVSALFVLVLFATISVSAQSPSGSASLSTVLNADGSIRPNITGSFDPSGFKLIQGPKGEPRFVPADKKPEGSCSDGWDTDFSLNGTNPITDVSAIVTDGSGNVYIGGNFTVVNNIFAQSIAKWDGTTWSKLGSGVSFGSGVGFIRAIAISGTDIYVAGVFTSAGGVPANNVAKWNGSSWSALGSGVGGQVMPGGFWQGVYAIAVWNGDVYVGGNFDSATGSPNKIARWDGTSWTTVGSGVDREVYALAVYGGALHVGGNFSTAGGATIRNIAKWDGSNWSQLGSGIGGYVLAIAVSGTSMYVGGAVSAVGATGFNILKWDGTNWSGLGNGTAGVVGALAISGNDVYVGGDFMSASGVPASRIAKWNGSGWSALGSGMEAFGGPSVSDIAVSGNTVFVGGMFEKAGGVPARNIAKWDTGGSWSALPGTSLDNGPLTMTALANDVYLGGNFSAAGSLSLNKLAKWNGSAFSALGSGVGPSGTASVGPITVSGNNVYIGGSFSTAGGISANNIAMWNGSAWSPLGSGVNGPVTAITVATDGVYVGGSFLTAGGVTVNRIARWNGTAWSALGTGLDGTVSVIKAVGPDIYVAGSFENAGGVTAHRIAKWNGTNWVGLNSGLLVSTPHTIAVSGSDLYVAAESTTIDSSSYIAKYDGTTWTGLGAGMAGHGVRTLAVLGTDVYITGAFATVGGVTVNRIAKWNGSSWSALGGGVPSANFGTNNNVRAVVAGSELIVSGDFTTAAGGPANYVAKWNGSAWSSLGAGLDAPATTITPVGGYIYFGGGFTTAGCHLSPYFARWRQTIWTGSANPDWHTGANWGDGSVPAASAGVIISASDASITSSDVTLSSLIVTNSRTLTIGSGRTLTVNGNLDLRDGFVTGPGALVVKGDLTLNGGSVSNISSLTVDRHLTLNSGNISGPGTISVKGDLNLSGNITNVTSLTVEHTLALSGGKISGTGTVLLTACATTAISGGSDTSFIASPLTRCVNGSGIYRFPVGTGSVYSPAELANVTGSANFTVEAHAGPYGAAADLPANRLQRWWSTVNGGITQADITFNYVDADVVSNENYYRVFRISGGSAVRVPTSFQPTANRATIPATTVFSDFTLAEGVSTIQTMTGRITTASGRGAENVVITLTDELGNSQWYRTPPAGYYRFPNLSTIRTYTMTFQSKKFKILPRTVMFDGDGPVNIVGSDH